MNSGRTSLNQLQNSFVFIRFFFLFLIWIRTLFKKNQTKTNFKTMDQARKILPFKHAVVDVNQNMAFDLFIYFLPFLFLLVNIHRWWWGRRLMTTHVVARLRWRTSVKCLEHDAKRRSCLCKQTWTCFLSVRYSSYLHFLSPVVTPVFAASDYL